MDAAAIKRHYGSMRPALLTAVAVAAVFTAQASWAANELCKQLHAFERAPLAKLADGDLQRRWMDFSWGGPENLAEDEVQIGATLKCHGSDEVATSLCKYVLHNTPHENNSYLPLAILGCHGFVSAPDPYPRQWVEELSWETPSGYIEKLQIEQLIWAGTEPSIRLSIMPFPESPQAKRPAPFFKALSSKLGSEDDGD